MVFPKVFLGFSGVFEGFLMVMGQKENPTLGDHR